jgi:hypothetical protein
MNEYGSITVRNISVEPPVERCNKPETINSNSAEFDADVGKLYIWPPASVSLVVEPSQVLVFRLVKPFGHWARSIMCEPTTVEPVPNPAARSGMGMMPAMTQES